jgi:hypothetical protein
MVILNDYNKISSVESSWFFYQEDDGEPTGLVLSQSPVAMPSFEKLLREEGHLSLTSFYAIVLVIGRVVFFLRSRGGGKPTKV